MFDTKSGLVIAKIRMGFPQKTLEVLRLLRCFLQCEPQLVGRLKRSWLIIGSRMALRRLCLYRRQTPKSQDFKTQRPTLQPFTPRLGGAIQTIRWAAGFQYAALGVDQPPRHVTASIASFRYLFHFIITVAIDCRNIVHTDTAVCGMYCIVVCTVLT